VDPAARRWRAARAVAASFATPHRPLSDGRRAEVEIPMTRFLFETPWWFPAILAGIGLFLFWTGNRRQEEKVRTAGWLLILLAIAVCAISYLVDTDREKALKDSKTLVYSVQKRDWATMKAMLDPTCGLSILGGIPIYASRDEILKGAQDAVDKYGLRDVRVLNASAEQDPTQIRVTLTALSDQDFTQGRPIPSTWLLDWQQTGSDWRLARITCVRIANLEGSAAGEQFPQWRR
jgi:hypothetical protein